MITVRTYTDNGPSFGATLMSYQASSLKEMLFHIRLAMEDYEDMIAVFDGDECKGIWTDEAEPSEDDEGGYCLPPPSYQLQRKHNGEKAHRASNKAFEAALVYFQSPCNSAI